MRKQGEASNRTLYRSLVPILRVRRGRPGCAVCVVALAAVSLAGCASNDRNASPAYQRGYDFGRGGEIRHSINQGKLAVAACDDRLKADKVAQGYNLDDQSVYKEGCLDGVRAQGIQPRAGF
jgi:hypothetical protein